MTLSASVLTITAFTVERYVAICHPIKSQTMSGLGRAIKSIIAIWVLAGVTALPYPLHAGTFYYSKDPSTNISIPDSLQCSILPNYIILIKVVIQLSTFILFVAPMTIISVLYVLIGITLRKSSIARRSSSNCTTPSSIHSQQARRAVLKMLGKIFYSFCKQLRCRLRLTWNLYQLIHVNCGYWPIDTEYYID